VEVEDKIIESLTESAKNNIDDRLRTCLQVWGVDTNNKDECKRRCEIHIFEGDKYRRVIIDGYPVMQFTDCDIDHGYSMENDKLSMNMTMRCSRIMTPSDYGIDELT